MIVVAGEALIDLIGEDGVLRSHLGGGPFNTAVALGRLGVPVGFLGRLSNDRFGQLLAARFAESGVDERYIDGRRGADPARASFTTPRTAITTFTFYLAETAYADLTVADLPELAADVVAVSAGTLGLATDPPESCDRGVARAGVPALPDRHRPEHPPCRDRRRGRLPPPLRALGRASRM